jgi:hypothetical protein
MHCNQQLSKKLAKFVLVLFCKELGGKYLGKNLKLIPYRELVWKKDLRNFLFCTTLQRFGNK